MNNTLSAIAEEKQRILLTLATGTGKTANAWIKYKDTDLGAGVSNFIARVSSASVTGAVYVIQNMKKIELHLAKMA